MSSHSTLQNREPIIGLAAPKIARDSRQSAVIRQSASVFLGQIVLLLCGVLNSFLVAYLVGPEGRGLIYLLQFISGGVGLTLMNFGLGPAAVFYLVRTGAYSLANVAAGLFWASLLLGILPMLVLGPAWHWIAKLATREIAPSYLWLALCAIPAMNLTFNAGFLCLAQKRIRTYNWLRIGPSVLFSLSLFAVFFGRSGTIRVIAAAWAITTVAPATFALELIRRASDAWSLAGTRKFLRGAILFGWHSHLGAVTQYLQHRSDILLVSYFLPLKELGLYAFAVSLAELLWYVPHAVGTVLLPHVAGTPEEEIIHITPLVCRATLALTALLSVGLAVAGTWLIPWILPAFQASVRVIWILIPGVIAASLFKVLASDFNGRGRPIETFYPALIALGAGLICGVIVIPRFGIFGAAVVTTAGYLLNASLYIRSYVRMTSVPIGALLFLRSHDLAAANANLRQEWSIRIGR